MPAFLLTPLAKYAAIGLGVILLLLAIWSAIDSYGDGREKAGVDRTVAAYKAASDRLREQARQSATRADDAAAERQRQQTEQVAHEVERINEAESTGDSPLDVLFGS